MVSFTLIKSFLQRLKFLKIIRLLLIDLRYQYKGFSQGRISSRETTLVRQASSALKMFSLTDQPLQKDTLRDQFEMF